MRRFHERDARIVAQTLAVDMADHGRALGAARPVATGAIFAGREGAAFRVDPVSTSWRFGAKPTPGMIWPRSVRRVSKPSLLLSLCRSSTSGRDHVALEILPWAVADAVARIDARLAVGRLGAEVGAPGFAARAVALRQRLAVLVGALDAAEVGALAGPGAGDEERHVGRLRQLRRRCRRGCCCACTPDSHDERRERQCGTMNAFLIAILRWFFQ
jgi:hypothetical protein